MEKAEAINSLNGSEIAIIGFACRFPGAQNAEEFWLNLRNGIETISFLKEEEIEPSLVDPADPGDQNYVKAAALLDQVEMFDAAFFGFTPKEAVVMDPQHRLFLECAWETLEHAGYDSETYPFPIGVFAGARTNTYIFNLFANANHVATLGAFEIGLGNDLAFLPTRVSHKLNLRGPSYAVHTACSTSLVAVHLACQSLLVDECRMALAGGVAVNVPQRTGYLYTRGGISSPDGHCRAFDARAQGTLFGSGLGVVLLKRLEDALADGDTIHALIKGTAVNNDGAAKASFTAPSVYGQAEVIAEALANSGVEPETISYIETHGTGTALGDPIEIRGLMKAFQSNRKNFCAIGSVKTNLGHLDAAAGVASLLKTVLALKHGLLPPSLHFTAPNPNIDFENSPFCVNHTLTEWRRNDGPRRAGVSAFGVGGTNAHVILEEAPPAEPAGASRSWQLLTLAARSPDALDAATTRLAEYLERHPEASLADVAYTLKVGRRPFGHRRAMVCQDVSDALQQLRATPPHQSLTQTVDHGERRVAFLFPGGGAQYPDMARDLYENESVFRERVDHCCALLEPELGYDLREWLFHAAGRAAEAAERLKRTATALPALFVIEYALAELWMSWGIRPEAMIGHSLGEYVAACLAGVFSLPDALALVALRGRLFEQLPPGAMLSVSAPEDAAREWLGQTLSIAAINSPHQCVISGPKADIDALAATLAEKEIELRYLHIDVAAHSWMLAPILGPFREFVARLKLGVPAIPFLSNVTGDWIKAEEASSPDYWVTHLRQTVRFSAGLQELMREHGWVLLEVGPGQTLSTLVKLQGEMSRNQIAISSIRHPYERQPDQAFLLTTLGKLWLAGVQPDWAGFYRAERRRRAPLPTYPFERQRYWLEPGRTVTNGHVSAQGKAKDVADWFYLPAWKQGWLPKGDRRPPGECESRRYLVLAGETSLAQGVLNGLSDAGHTVICVRPGREYIRRGEEDYSINPTERVDYQRLLKQLSADGAAPTDIVHLWSLSAAWPQSSWEYFNQAQNEGFYSLLFLAQAIGAEADGVPLHLWVVSDGLHAVESADELLPEKATLLGPCKVIPQEYQNVISHCLDVRLPKPGSADERQLLAQLLDEIKARAHDTLVAYRGARRWAQTFEPVRLTERAEQVRQFRPSGVYLITGGLGGVGLQLATHLARTVKARLALTGRAKLPERAEWDTWLATHDADDPISRKISKVREMEQLGAEVMIVAVDVADLAGMTSLLKQIDKRFGGLHGVIHAAGITSGASVFTPISEFDPTEAAAQFRPKAQGLYALRQLLQGRAIDFCVLTSSNSSVLGGMGFVAYSASNAFMDAFASAHGVRDGTAWISSSWDPWPEETKKYVGFQTSMDKYAMTLAESWVAFERVATMVEQGHVVVATGDLPHRLNLWINRAFAEPVDDMAHPRPTLTSIYHPPEGETEQRIAAIWRRLLGIEQVGRQDNFFDLGGHSLLATRLVARLRDEFRAELPLQKFFAAPTVAGLAQAIDEAQISSEEQERQAILAMLANLSEEQVEAEISKRAAPQTLASESNARV